MVPRALFVLLLAFGCRDFHDTIERPLEDCQPYDLACTTCTYDDDVADRTDLQRVYRCASGGVDYDAVQRRSPEGGADDTHYYDVDSGYRVAAGRWWDEPVDVCGHEVDIEWYGAILDDCEAVCEHERHSASDEALPDC